MIKNYKLVYGVGINNSDYIVGGTDKETGKRWVCPFYRSWQHMLERCYSSKRLERFSTYTSCSVCPEWLYFKNFRLWMENQDWKGKHLDKDLLIDNNKIYSPETCIFVNPILNTFTIDSGKTRGEYLIGVCFNKTLGKLVAKCGNPITKKQEHIGYFDSELSAHLAWKSRKLELVDELLESGYIEDMRIYSNLKAKYSNKL